MARSKAKPWAAFPSDYRAIKIPDLAATVAAEHRLLDQHTDDRAFAELLGEPMQAQARARLEELRLEEAAIRREVRHRLRALPNRALESPQHLAAANLAKHNLPDARAFLRVNRPVRSEETLAVECEHCCLRPGVCGPPCRRKASCGVEELHALANREDRQLPFERSFRRREFPSVALRFRIRVENRRVRHRLIEELGRHIGAATQKQALHFLQRHLLGPRVPKPDMRMPGEGATKPFVVFLANPGGHVRHGPTLRPFIPVVNSRPGHHD